MKLLHKSIFVVLTMLVMMPVFAMMPPTDDLEETDCPGRFYKGICYATPDLKIFAMKHEKQINPERTEYKKKCPASRFFDGVCYRTPELKRAVVLRQQRLNRDRAK